MRADSYHELLQELITEAERNAHKPQQRLIFMGCVARLVPVVELYTVRHFAQLLPLLLEWTHGYDEASVVAALQVLACVVQHAWPRMGVHAGVLWQHLELVVQAAEERQWLETGRKRHVEEQQLQEAVELWEERGMCDSPVMQAVAALASLLSSC